MQAAVGMHDRADGHWPPADRNRSKTTQELDESFDRDVLYITKWLNVECMIELSFHYCVVVVFIRS